MPTRRRINAPSMGRRTFLYGLAATAAAAPLVSWGVRQSPTLVESPGVSPIAAKLSTSPLADSVTMLVDDAAVGTHTISDALHPLRGFVKDITRDEPFSQFALTWPGDSNVELYVRAEREDGNFGPWFHADSHAPMNGSGQSGTELLFVEPTKRVQVSTIGLNLLEGMDPRSIVGLDRLDPSAIGENLQSIIDGTAALALNSVQAVFVDGVEQSGQVITPIAYESAISGAPKVISRAGWGADESARSGSSSYQTFKGTCIHHTAGSNSYTESQAPAIVRGIYAYHAQTLGWGDVGYNALVDKFGNIYEGRYGGLDKNIEGAHAGGFNDGTFGISVMGNYDQIAMPSAAVAAVGEMVGWRMKVGGVDPMSTASLTSSGYSKSRYSSGQTVNLPAIFGHRDTGYTSCPGNFGYQQMDDIRAAAKAKYDGNSGAGITGGSKDPDSSEQSGLNLPGFPGAEDSQGSPEGSTGSTGAPSPAEFINNYLADGLPGTPGQAARDLFAPQR
ncbi:MAG: N-acetylmuramoyl-L-alanine amidase [Corynebacterium sp.]|uniref:N-acetylmuramoyl-L-alanine amidase n=1 Tax=Corynebacterium sp. TaxID=1720 RepID=UPI0026DC76A5|nr:N-acetylmuramoyl-L-alanine amidase [Corynebacterium sp.]MDO5029960.1 N-acetylmuramoyl-L-alanine amidase [Corynebacterium sp.]